MSDTPVENQTVIDKDRAEQIGPAKQIGPADADLHGAGNRSLEAGGEFLKALAADRGAIPSRLRLLLAARHRRPQPPPVSTSSPVSSGSGIGRVAWRISMVFLGLLLICSGALSAAMLWVVFGSPFESGRSDPNTPGLRAEATNDASLSRRGTVNAAGPSRPDVGRVAEVPIQPGLSSAGAAESEKPTEQTNPDAQAVSNQPQPLRTEADETKAAVQFGSNQPQPLRTEAQETKAEAQGGSNRSQPVRAEAKVTKAESTVELNQPQPVRPVRTAMRDGGPGAGRQEISAKLTDQRPGMRCNVDLCAATYKSFNAADCTYQPIGGGPRSICELSAQPAATPPQLLRVAADPSTKATEPRPTAAVKPIAAPPAPDRAGSQCNRTLCAATYRSFNAADCTYEPYGGGPRSICELGRGSVDAPQQPSHATTDSRHPAPPADDMPVAGMEQNIAEPPGRAGPQCNRSRCAATYRSFHAADCTYQSEGGGPRRICEP